MTTQRRQVTVDVHVILERDGRVLLSLRQGTGYADGLYCLPSGHLDPGESVVDCAVREAREEVGVTIDPGRLRPVAVVHYLFPPAAVRESGSSSSPTPGTARWSTPSRTSAPRSSGCLMTSYRATPFRTPPPESGSTAPASVSATWLA